MQEYNIYIAFLAILLATFLRLYLPAKAAKRKADRDGEEFKWDHKYSISAASSIALSLVIVSMIFLGFDVEQHTHPLFTFAAAFTYGFTQTTVFNQIVDWVREINA